MYLLQLVQALKYENFSDIQGGLEPGSKRESQGLSDDSTLDRLVFYSQVILAVVVTASMWSHMEIVLQSACKNVQVNDEFW